MHMISTLAVRKEIPHQACCANIFTFVALQNYADRDDRIPQSIGNAPESSHVLDWSVPCEWRDFKFQAGCEGSTFSQFK